MICLFLVGVASKIPLLRAHFYYPDHCKFASYSLGYYFLGTFDGCTIPAVRRLEILLEET